MYINSVTQNPFHTITWFRDSFREYCVQAGMDEYRRRLLVLLEIEVERAEG